MSTPVNTLFFHVANTVVTPQLNQGPFTINPCNKLLELTVKGVFNVQSTVVASPVVSSNVVVVAAFWVPHGAAIPNIIGGSDGRNFLARQQMGQTDYGGFWSPSTSDAVVEGGFGIDMLWRGQQVTGGGIDIYVSFATPFAGGIATCIVNGTMRARAV